MVCKKALSLQSILLHTHFAHINFISSKMTRSTFRGLCVCLSAVALASCQDYDGGFTESQIKEAAYAKKFVKAFGEVDPNQDWNLATRASVTVSNANDAEVKIYAKTDGVYKIVADYTEVNGTQELGFDMLETVTELLVTNGSESYYVKPGESVSFGTATRAIFSETADGISKAGVTIGDYVEFDADKYVGAVTKTGTGILPEEEPNLGKVVQNFSYISNGPFTIHPIYWQSSSSHVLGVYWKEGNTYHYQDVYQDMDAAAKDLATRTITYSGECSHYWKEPTVGMTCSSGHTIYKITTDGEGKSHFWYKKQDPCYASETYDCVEGYMCQEHGKVTHVPSEHTRYHDGEAECTCGLDKFGIEYYVGDVCPTCGEILHMEWGKRYTIENRNYTGIGGTAPTSGMIYSKGITIDLPVGTQFGFYLKVYTSGSYYHTLYSQGELNEAKKGDFFTTSGYTSQGGCSVRTSGLNKEGTSAWAATFQTQVDGQNVQYLCFEDWSNNMTDLNDLVFATPVTPTSTPPSIVDDDAHSWIICAEDLGNTFDLDYNDVVVEVSYVNGKDKATITPRAAGGTLASYIYFNGTSGDQCLGEIHELFGQQNTVSGGYTPLNVDGSVNASSSPIEVGVSTTWSIASSTVGDASFAGSSAMGGFYLKVVPAGEESSASNATINGQKIQNGTFGSGNDNAPLVFCVPRDWSRDEGTTRYSSWFRWSNELTPMSTLSGYTDPSYNTTGHSFANWVADHTAATDWYKYPVTGKTTGAKGISTTTISEDSGSGSTDGGNTSGGSQGGGNSSTPTTTTGLSIGSEYVSNINFGSAYYVTVTENTFDTTKGGTLTIYCTAASDELFIADSSENQVVKGSGTSRKTECEIILSAQNIATIASGFYIGTWSTPTFTISSIVYSPEE